MLTITELITNRSSEIFLRLSFILPVVIWNFNVKKRYTLVLALRVDVEFYCERNEKSCITLFVLKIHHRNI